MKTTVTDDIGTYTINVTNKPVELEEAEAIFLNLHHNGPEAANEYVITLTCKTQDGEYHDYNCAILNRYSAYDWLRNVNPSYKEADFYQQYKYMLNDLKKEECVYDKKPSAGIFRKPKKSSNTDSERKNIQGAIALMYKEKDEDPIVAIRFFDFTWIGPIPPNDMMSRNKAKYATCIKSDLQHDDEDDIINEDLF